jgi:hypothetical protein
MPLCLAVICVLQRIRQRAGVHFERAFKQCDIIITPATPTTAETFPAAAHTSGVYDVAKTFEQIRFTQVRHRLMRSKGFQAQCGSMGCESSRDLACAAASCIQIVGEGLSGCACRAAWLE